MLPAGLVGRAGCCAGVTGPRLSPNGEMILEVPVATLNLQVGFESLAAHYQGLTRTTVLSGDPEAEQGTRRGPIRGQNSSGTFDPGGAAVHVRQPPQVPLRAA